MVDKHTWAFPSVDDPIDHYMRSMNQQIQNAYKQGLGDGWFQGYDLGFEDGESRAMYDQDQNPYRKEN